MDIFNTESKSNTILVNMMTYLDASANGWKQLTLLSRKKNYICSKWNVTWKKVTRTTVIKRQQLCDQLDYNM